MSKREMRWIQVERRSRVGGIKNRPITIEALRGARVPDFIAATIRNGNTTVRTRIDSTGRTEIVKPAHNPATAACTGCWNRLLSRRWYIQATKNRSQADSEKNT